MVDPVFVDGVTPLNSVNLTKLQTRDEKGQANGYAPLDSTGKVPAAQGGNIIPTVVNGQWLKGVGGAAVWSAITPADVGVPKVTRGTFSAGPPGSPTNGDLWVVTDSNWVFTYNSGSPPYPWVFSGGVPFQSTNSISVLTTSAWTTLLNFTAGRAGIYQFTGGIFGATTGSWLVGWGKNGANQAGLGALTNAASSTASAPIIPAQATLVASDVLNLQYYATAGLSSGNLVGSWLVWPALVS